MLFNKFYNFAVQQVATPDLAGLYCSVCFTAAAAMAKSKQLANRENQAFIDVPSSNKDLIDACRKHIKSDSHKNALAMPLVQPLLQDTIKLNDAQTRIAMEHKFVVAYWIAQEHVANDKYESLHEMLVGSIDGCADLFRVTQKISNRHLEYGGVHFFKQAVTAIAEAVRLAMLKDVQASEFRCLSSDETSRHRKNMLCITYKYFVGSLANGTLATRTSFAAIRELPDGSANSVFSACRAQEQRDGLRVEKLSIYCADGANVQAGCHNGVVAKYQELQPTCVYTHCCSHKTALVGRDATDEVPVFRDLMNFVEALGRFYDASTTKDYAFRQVQIYMGFIPAVSIGTSCHTRWLSHYNTVKSLVARFPCVLTELKTRQYDDPAACGFYSFFGKIENIGLLLIDADILPLLASLNTSQQDPDLDMSQLVMLLDATEKALIDMRDNVSKMINFNQLDLMVQIVGEYGHEVKLTAGRTPEWLDRQRKDYLNAIIACQRARFPDKTLLGFIAELLTPSRIPLDNDLRRLYGEIAIATILCHFAKSDADEYRIDPILLRAEYTVYKEAVVAHSPPLSNLKSAAQLFRGNVFLNLKSIRSFVWPHSYACVH